MKKELITGIIIATLILGGFILFSQKNKPKEYANKEIGISFKLPSQNWNVVDKVIESSESERGGHYWINVKNRSSEISFDIRKTGKVGGFVLSTSTKSKLHKATSTDNIHIWRPKESIIKDKKELTRMYRQPKDEEVTFKDKRAFNFIFPEFNQKNNVGDLFDGGSGRFVNNPFSVAISGGIDLSSNVKSQLDDIDYIIKSLSFEKPEKNSFSVSTSTPIKDPWQTYRNDKYQFSLQYPSDYNSFVEIGKTEDQLMEIEAISEKSVLINGGYNHYPKISVSLSPINSYEFETFYNLSYYYDAEKDQCYKVENGVKETYPFSISKKDWDACRVGTGDAGWSVEGYSIPLEEKEIVVTISNSSYYGSRRPLPFKTIVKSLETFSN